MRPVGSHTQLNRAQLSQRLTRQVAQGDERALDVLVQLPHYKGETVAEIAVEARRRAEATTDRTLLQVLGAGAGLMALSLAGPMGVVASAIGLGGLLVHTAGRVEAAEKSRELGDWLLSDQRR